MGGPASGKGTQGHLLAEKFEFNHLSAGELLRNALKQKNDTSEIINKYINTGKIVPSYITTNLLRNKIEEKGLKSNFFLIDGYPRN